MLTLLLSACQPAADSGAPEVIDTGTWSAPERVVPAPEWSPEVVVAELDELGSEGLPNLQVTLDNYIELMALGDETCPGDPTRFDDSTVPLTGCTSEAGVTYSGVAAMFQGEELGGGVEQGFIVFGDFEFIDTEGHKYIAGGKSLERVEPIAGGLLIQTGLSGTWSYPATPGWFADGASGALRTEGELVDGSLSLEITGGLGLRGRATYTPGLFFDDAACPDGEPTGEMRIRDPSGGWWTVTLEDDCSGCGLLTWTDGTDYGEVCPGLAALGTSWRASASRYAE